MKKESLYLAATAGRLIQARSLWKRVDEEKPIKGTVAAILAIDLGDGIGARHAGVDGPRRRALDSMVDSIFIATGLTALWRKRPETRPYVAALAVREIFVGSGWAMDLGRSRQVKKGDDLHKLASGSIAAFAVAATSENKTAMQLTGAAAIGINSVLAYDYYKGWTQPERNVMLDTGVAEVPGFYEARQALRSLRYNGPPQLTAGDNTGIVLELAMPATTEQLPSTSL
jgi:hypothetical protein